MAGTPISEIVATIEEVKRIQIQIDGLADAIRRLAQRVEAIEGRQAPDAPPAAGAPKASGPEARGR